MSIKHLINWLQTDRSQSHASRNAKWLAVFGVLLAVALLSSFNAPPAVLARPPAASTANNDVAVTDEGVAVEIFVLSNDSTDNGQMCLFDNANFPEDGANGTTSVNTNNLADGFDDTITYTPNTNFFGVDTFDYRISDCAGSASTATVTVTVNPINDPPVANDDSDSVDEDSSVDIDVLANDTDPDGNDLEITAITSGPPNGTATIDINSTPGDTTDDFITYVPDPDYNGSDSFTYEISDGIETDTATVNVTVNPINDPPVANNDSPTIDEDNATNINVLSNDTDVDGDTLSVTSITSQATNGFASINPDDTIAYTPDLNYNGSDSFTYEISDGNGGTDTATVNITINSVNDPPVAGNDSDTINEDTSSTLTYATIISNDTDADGDTLTISSITSGPANGAASINDQSTANPSDDTVTYTPDPDFNGVDSFVYQITDGNGGSDTGTITITVSPINDAPVADDDSASTPEDTPVDIDVLSGDTDIDNDPLQIASITVSPTNGSVSIDDNGTAGDTTDDFITYTPDLNYFGPDSFEYELSDGNGGTDTATVSITVNSVNDPPVADDYFVTGTVDQFVTVQVVFDSNDVEDDTPTDLIISSFQSTTSIGANIIKFSDTELQYQPLLGFIGTDTFTYTIRDSDGATDTGRVSVTITPDNLPPEAVDDSDSTSEDTPVTIAVLSNDSDAEDSNNDLTISNASQPANGSVTINGANTPDDITYTPDLNYAGPDSFDYTVCDTGGLCDTATVTVTISPINDAPVANDDEAATTDPTPVTIDLVANDNDPDGTLDLGSISLNTGGTTGSVANNGNGTVTYTPAAAGTDTFTYTIDDNNGATSNSATVTVTVNDSASAADVPTADDDAASTSEDNSVDIPVLNGDTDPNGDTLTVTSFTQGGNSLTVVRKSTNSAEPDYNVLVYTPQPDFNGSDSFAYTVCNTSNLCDSATVTVNVSAVNDPPVANNDVASTDLDTNVTISVLSNDTDVDGTIDATSVVVAVNPTNGTTTVNANGTITYDPNPNFTGSDTFQYTVEDNNGAISNSATVTVNVRGTTQFVFVNDESATVEPGQTVTHTHTLTNVDNSSDQYRLELQATTDNWTQTLEIYSSTGTLLQTINAGGNYTTPTIPPAGFVTMDHSITVPQGTSNGTTQSASILASSVTDPSVTGAVTDSYTVSGGCLTGVVYEDNDRDGTNDGAEDKLGNVNLSLYDGGTLVSTVTTNNSGEYAFNGIGAGTYEVRLDSNTLPGGNFVFTNPSSDTANVTVAASNTCATRNWGIFLVDVSITMTGPTSVVTTGRTGTFTIKVRNATDGPITGVIVTDPLGTNMEYVSASTTQGTFQIASLDMQQRSVLSAYAAMLNGTLWDEPSWGRGRQVRASDERDNDLLSNLAQGSNTITFNIGTVAANTTITMQVTVRVVNDPPQIITNTATLSFNEGPDQQASASITTFTPTATLTPTTVPTATSRPAPTAVPSSTPVATSTPRPGVLPETGIRMAPAERAINLSALLAGTLLAFLVSVSLLLVTYLERWPAVLYRVGASLLGLSTTAFLAVMWLARVNRSDLLAIIVFDALVYIVSLLAIIGVLFGAFHALRGAVRGERRGPLFGGLALALVSTIFLVVVSLSDRPPIHTIARIPGFNLINSADIYTDSGDRQGQASRRIPSRDGSYDGTEARLPLPAGPVKSISIPDLEVAANLAEAPIDGRTWNVFGLGSDVAHLEGTAHPGTRGNAVLAGHVETRNGVGPFVNLDKLEVGDVIIAEGDGVNYIYEVTDMMEVKATDVQVADQTISPMLTLITCTDWDAAKGYYTGRYVVKAKFVRTETSS